MYYLCIRRLQVLVCASFLPQFASHFHLNNPIMLGCPGMLDVVLGFAYFILYKTTKQAVETSNLP